MRDGITTIVSPLNVDTEAKRAMLATILYGLSVDDYLRLKQLKFINRQVETRFFILLIRMSSATLNRYGRRQKKSNPNNFWHHAKL